MPVHSQFTFLLSFFTQVLHLPANGATHVKQRPVQKAAVKAVLHLHDDIFSRVRQAVQIVDNTRICHAVGVILLVQENQIRDTVLPRKQLVKERDKQFLAGRLSEYNLESNIRKRVHKMPARQIHTVHNFSFRLFDFTKKAKNRQKNKFPDYTPRYSVPSRYTTFPAKPVSAVPTHSTGHTPHALQWPEKATGK